MTGAEIVGAYGLAGLAFLIAIFALVRSDTLDRMVARLEVELNAAKRERDDFRERLSALEHNHRT